VGVVSPSVSKFCSADIWKIFLVRLFFPFEVEYLLIMGAASPIDAETQANIEVRQQEMLAYFANSFKTKYV